MCYSVDFSRLKKNVIRLSRKLQDDYKKIKKSFFGFYKLFSISHTQGGLKIFHRFFGTEISIFLAVSFHFLKRCKQGVNFQTSIATMLDFTGVFKSILVYCRGK